jgi:hypothetical protein
MEAPTKTQAAKIREHLGKFGESVKDSTEAIKKAAKHYYEALKINPSARDTFADAYPTVSSRTWSGFIRIASGEMDSRLLFDATSGARALSACDSETQAHYIENPVPVSCGNGDTMLVQLDKMTSEQARQVFNRGTVRDLAEQRAWIETQKTRNLITIKPTVDKANEVYVKGSNLHAGSLVLTRAELLRYLGQMEQ